MVESIFLSLVIAVVAGVILLIIEYRTSWFQKHLADLKSKTDDSMGTLSIPDSLNAEIVGKSVTSIEELTSPVGDWFQIAKEVEAILEEIYCKEIEDGGEYIPQIELIAMKPVKNSNEYELQFDLTTNFSIGIAYVTIKPSGKIVKFEFKRS